MTNREGGKRVEPTKRTHIHIHSTQPNAQLQGSLDSCLLTTHSLDESAHAELADSNRRWAPNLQKRYLLSSHRPLGAPKVPTSTPTLQLGWVVSNITLSSPVHTSNTTPWVLECGLEAPAKPRSTHRARALTPRGGTTKLDHIVGKWPRPVCTAVSPPATSRARTTVRLRL